MNAGQNQQGDVWFEKVDSLPVKAIKTNNPVLAYGEATGFAHKVTSKTTEVWECGGQQFLIVPEGQEGIIEHTDKAGNGQHQKTILEPGIHQVGKVLEYDHFTEEAKQVQD